MAKQNAKAKKQANLAKLKADRNRVKKFKKNEPASSKKKADKKSKEKNNKKDESITSSINDMSFDEEAIKERITKMVEEYKRQGGVLELGDGSDHDDDVSDSGGNSDGAGGVDFDGDDNQEDTDDDDEPERKASNKSYEADEESDAQTNVCKTKDEKEDRKKQREKRKFDFERNSRTIFVGNLPTTFDHKSVAKLFKSCGPVEAARIRSIIPAKEKLSPKVAIITKNLHSKVNSFNAYVVFKNNEDDECVKKALEMNGKLIEDHHIRVDRAQRPKAKKETLTSRKKSIFVGNLRFDLRDDELINHFKKIGPVNYVRIVRDSGTGLGKGFGFVVFDDRASVKKALELNDTQFKGRSLRVKKVVENKNDKKS